MACRLASAFQKLSQSPSSPDLARTLGAATGFGGNEGTFECNGAATDLDGFEAVRPTAFAGWMDAIGIERGIDFEASEGIDYRSVLKGVAGIFSGAVSRAVPSFAGEPKRNT